MMSPQKADLGQVLISNEITKIRCSDVFSELVHHQGGHFIYAIEALRFYDPTDRGTSWNISND
jgi:hypothetical protein